MSSDSGARHSPVRTSRAGRVSSSRVTLKPRNDRPAGSVARGKWVKLGANDEQNDLPDRPRVGHGGKRSNARYFRDPALPGGRPGVGEMGLAGEVRHETE